MSCSPACASNRPRKGPQASAIGASAQRGEAERSAPGARPSSRLRRSDLEAPPGFEPGIKALQASALPLGDGAERRARSLAGLACRATAQYAAGARMVELVDTEDSSLGLPRGDARVTNRVNSGKPKALLMVAWAPYPCSGRRCQGNPEPSRSWDVPSRVLFAQGNRGFRSRAWVGCPREFICTAEGAETSGVSPNDNPRRRAPGVPRSLAARTKR